MAFNPARSTDEVIVAGGEDNITSPERRTSEEPMREGQGKAEKARLLQAIWWKNPIHGILEGTMETEHGRDTGPLPDKKDRNR